MKLKLFDECEIQYFEIVDEEVINLKIKLPNMKEKYIKLKDKTLVKEFIRFMTNTFQRNYKDFYNDDWNGTNRISKLGTTNLEAKHELNI